MTSQPQAQLYLADQRGSSETDRFRSCQTFNFGPYQHESRRPFGSLYLANDDMLRAGASVSMQPGINTLVVLIPVTGGLAYTIHEDAGMPTAETSAENFLEPGQAGIFGVSDGRAYAVSNPYETESIHFLQFWLRIPTGDYPFAGGAFSFDLSRKNTLLPLWYGPADKVGICGFIGRYEGRQAGSYPVTSGPDAPGTGVFVFVLSGVFEVANRLLHEKDSLSLWYQQSDVVEFEALSNEAILLLIDLSVIR